MHDVIEFDDIMKVVKRVLPAVQQLILGQTGSQTLPKATHPVFPAGLSSAHQTIRRLFAILYAIMHENRVAPILTATSVPVHSTLNNPSGLNYASAWEYVIQVQYLSLIHI